MRTIGKLGIQPQVSQTAEGRTSSLTESVMTPSEKDELLRTVSCQGKEYSQGQTDPHLVISRKIRREYLVSMVKVCSPRTLRRGI